MAIKVSFRELDIEPELSKIDKPLYVIHGKKDGLVDCEMSDIICNNVPNCKGKYIVDDTDHIGALGVNEELYWEKVDSFFESYLQ